MQIKIFNYIEELDCFIVEKDYKFISERLGLNEWNHVVWIGRFFTLDNDYGEHWFDNWEQRDKLENKAKELNIEYDDLLIIDPSRLINNIDGPCHTDSERIRFWTDVLKSLELSLDTIFTEARKLNEEYKLLGLLDEEEYLPDLENRIQEIKIAYS
jgi:hypothetical protein